MKSLALEVFISVIYVFDVSTYPFIHIPLYALTLLYLASMLEILGLTRLVRFLSRRFPVMRSDTNSGVLRPLRISGV